MVYYQRVDHGNRGGAVLVAPDPLQRITLEHCHDKSGAGHMEMNKTTECLKPYAIFLSACARRARLLCVWIALTNILFIDEFMAVQFIYLLL